MASVREKHRHWLAKAEHYAQLKAQRQDGLKGLARRTYEAQLRTGLHRNADPDEVISFLANGLNSGDSEMADFELLRSRAEQTAIMYGIAALVEEAE